jgi:hypothetical protein
MRPDQTTPHPALAPRRARIRRIRRSVVALAVALFVAAWSIIFVQLASGHDPALTRSSKAAGASGTSSSAQSSGGSSTGSGSAGGWSDDPSTGSSDGFSTGSPDQTGSGSSSSPDSGALTTQQS